MMIGGKRAGSVDGRERENGEVSSARKGILNKKATRRENRGAGGALHAGNAEEGRRKRARRGGGHDDSAGRKKSRAARELSRSRCVEPHPSRPLPSSLREYQASLPLFLSRLSRSFPLREGTRSTLSLPRGRIGARISSLLSESTIVFCFIITAVLRS